MSDAIKLAIDALEEVFVIGDRLVNDVYGYEFVEKAKAALAALRAQPDHIVDASEMVDHSEPFATMSITDDTGVIFSGLPSETVFKPGEKFHLYRVNSLEGKTK